MSFTVFLGNLPTWVTADDIRGWLSAENLVADAIKVIRNPETQESKGFAFIDAPNADEMSSIIRRFDRAPLEDRLLRANPAQPPKPKGQGERDRERRPHPHAGGHGPSGPVSHGPIHNAPSHNAGQVPAASAHAETSGHRAEISGQRPETSGQRAPVAAETSSISPAANPAANPPATGAADRPARRPRKTGARREDGPQSAFAEELARAL